MTAPIGTFDYCPTIKDARHERDTDPEQAIAELAAKLTERSA